MAWVLIGAQLLRDPALTGRYRRDMHRVRDAIEASVDRHVASATVTLPGVLSGPDLARLLDALCGAHVSSARSRGPLANDAFSVFLVFFKNPTFRGSLPGRRFRRRFSRFARSEEEDPLDDVG